MLDAFAMIQGYCDLLIERANLLEHAKSVCSNFFPFPFLVCLKVCLLFKALQLILFSFFFCIECVLMN